MRHITLEVPLGTFPVVGCGKRRYPANARVKPLSNTLDHATLARSIAAFKQNHHLVTRVLDPVLQFDEFPLQTKQFTEVLATAFFVLLCLARHFCTRQLINCTVFKRHLKLFVVTVNEIFADTPHQFVVYGLHAVLQSNQEKMT